MDYTEATGALMAAGVPLAEIAEAIGCSRATATQARMDPASDGHRSPPPGWRPALAGLAQTRGEALLEIAAALAAD